MKKRKTEVPMWICSILTLALFFASAAYGGDVTKKLPAMANLHRYGCTTKGPLNTINHNDPSGREHTVWVVKCWAEHKAPFDKKAKRDWRLWLGYYTSLEAGSKAAMKWMKQIKKASLRWRLENKRRTLQ